MNNEQFSSELDVQWEKMLLAIGYWPLAIGTD